MARYVSDEKKKQISNHAKSRKVSQIGVGVATYVGYVSFPRTNAIKERCEAWSDDSEMLTDAIATAIEMGYKLTVTAENDGETVKAAWYQQDKQRVDAGLGISAYGGEFWTAVQRATYFLAVEGEFNLLHPFFTQPDAKVKKDFWE